RLAVAEELVAALPPGQPARGEQVAGRLGEAAGLLDRDAQAVAGGGRRGHADLPGLGRRGPRVWAGASSRRVWAGAFSRWPAAHRGYGQGPRGIPRCRGPGTAPPARPLSRSPRSARAPGGRTLRRPAVARRSTDRPVPPAPRACRGRSGRPSCAPGHPRLPARAPARPGPPRAATTRRRRWPPGRCLGASSGLQGCRMHRRIGVGVLTRYYANTPPVLSETCPRPPARPQRGDVPLREPAGCGRGPTGHFGDVGRGRPDRPVSPPSAGPAAG